RRVDSLEVIWPDGRYQLLTGLEVDRLLVVDQKEAKGHESPNGNVASSPKAFEPLDVGRRPVYAHRASTAVDYAVQPLLPYMISRQGPALAVADVNRDGLDDVFV